MRVARTSSERDPSKERSRFSKAHSLESLMALICTHPLSLIDRILRRKEIMLESPVYREILEEGKAMGQEVRLREDVLEALEVRFGMVPYEVEEQVHRIRGRKTLEGLHRKAILVENLEAFAEVLSSVR